MKGKPSIQTESLPESGEPEAAYGGIVDMLVGEGHLTQQQIRYALRIQKKLETPGLLLDVLKEVGYITGEQIKKAIRENRLSMRLGNLLVELGYISEQALDNAIQIHETEVPKRRLGEILVSHNFISEKALLEVLSLQLGFPFVDPDLTEVDMGLFTRVPDRWYDNYQFVPIRREKTGVLVAFADPLNKRELDIAAQAIGEIILPAIASPQSIQKAIEHGRNGARTAHQLRSHSKDSVVGIVDALLIAAVEGGASDIHIEPLKDRLRIRFRQDGVLTHHRDYPKDIIPSLTSRLKVMSEVDITEKRRHQGGRLVFEKKGMKFDLRVSFYVTVYGEKIVLRLLNRQNELLELEELGMAPRILDRFIEDALEQPSGVVLITGPTGSGKTTTVYSSINRLNNPHTSILTAEEPVEYLIDGVSQCSINPKINLTFEETLRHIVRQDPDIIVIGEIRDNFSAEVSVQAALTGHKVLTTFHTEDSIGGLIRLLNMDIEAFMVASTVVSVLAQRLLRKVCSACAAPYTPRPVELQRLGCRPEMLNGVKLVRGTGCPECRYTGYKGRVGVYELLVPNDLVRNAIIEQKTTYELRSISVESTGLVTLLEDGLAKAAAGITTLEEVLRCLPRLQKPRPLGEIRRTLGM